MNDHKPPAPGADESAPTPAVSPSGDAVAAPRAPITPPDPTASVDGQATAAATPPPPVPAPAEPVTDDVVRPAAPVTGQAPPIDMVAPSAAHGQPPHSPADTLPPPPDFSPPPAGMPPPGSGHGMTVPTEGADRRPGFVTAVLVMLWVQVGLAFLGAALVGLLVLLSVADSRYQSTSGYQSIVARSALSSGALGVLTLLFFGTLMVVAAILLIKRLDFARVLTIALMGFFVFSNLTFIVFTVVNALVVGMYAAEQVIIMVLVPLVAAGMPAAILVLLALKPTVTWFYGDNRQTAKG